MKKTVFIILITLLLVSCTQATLPSETTIIPTIESHTSGPQGISNIEASNGVILLTPGQPYPTPILDLQTEVPDSSAPGIVETTPSAPIDPASVEMPEGIPIYPNANGLEVPSIEDPTGMGLDYVIFYTSDSEQQVIDFYTQKADEGGWSVMTTETEPNEMGILSQVWSKDNIFLVLQTYRSIDGQMKVQVSWMPM